ncbi:MAG: MATE family efflux transporter [Ruminococcaceae bacterium]|nr:MATE family efflux transporter [Oscillospiraceae bacterium]
MTNGPLLGKIIKFSIPLMLSGILQLFFNAADIIVVGNFAEDHTALAAVGSTGALINLIVNVFIGLSVGTNVLVARYYGAQDRKNIYETVQTSVSISLIFGVGLIFVGIFLARPLLNLMGTPSDVIDQSVLYVQIYFGGMPFMMLYNFGAAILRSVGDTKRPLYYLSFAGVINVLLNLFLVLCFNMGVAGVAIATVASQVVASILVLLCLVKTNAPYKVYLKELRVYKDKLIGMAKIGLPAGMQGAVFSISNVLIQSSINSFESVAMAGSTAAGNLEGFVYTAMNSFHQTALSFTGQNMGAKKYSRINRILELCVSCVAVTGLVLGGLEFLFAPQLLGIYNPDPDVIAFGVLRLTYIAIPYFLCGIMDVLVGSLRGIGCSVLPMIVSLTGACGFRILWIYTIFQMYHTPEVLFTSYPISWALTALVHFICFIIVRRKFPKKDL